MKKWTLASASVIRCFHQAACRLMSAHKEGRSMSINNELGRVNRKLPAGFFRLLLLAVLLGLVVLGWVTQAAEPAGSDKKASSVWDEDDIIVDTRNFDANQTLVITDNAEIVIDSSGLILARGDVEMDGSTSVSAGADSTLMIGSWTSAGKTPTENGMFAGILNMKSNDARLNFENVIVNQGTGDFNLGAIKRNDTDTFYKGGIYIGDDWVNKTEALNAKTLTTTDNPLYDEVAVSKLWINGDVTLDNGGSITLAGHKFGSGGIAGQTMDLTTGTAGAFNHMLDMRGGTLNSTGKYGAEVQMKDVLIAGGVVNLSAENLYLSGDNHDEISWVNAPAIIGASGNKGNAGSFKVTGGTVNLGDFGTLRTWWTEAGYAGKMSITGGTVNMNGGENSHAVLRAAADAGRSYNRNESTLTIGQDATVAVAAGRHGAILSRDTIFSGGSMNIDGSLVVAGAADESKSTVMDGIVSSGTNKWGDFRFGGGTMNVGSKGVVDFVTGDMTLTATAGNINGKLWVVDSDTAVNSKSDAGVYTTNLTVAKSDNRFTVRDLAINTTSPESGGVTIMGKMVVENTVTAVSDVSEGALSISGGSLTAVDKNFVTYEIDEKNNDITSFEVNSDLVTALTGSTGTLNLNTTDSSTALNMTAEQYAELKKALGITGGLNLLGVVVSNRLEWVADQDGNIDIEVINPSAEVAIDTGYVDGSTLYFNETVSVKELLLQNGEYGTGNIDTVVLGKTSTFTGSGNIDSSIIKGGVHDAMDVNVNGILNLGIAGNRDKQGGFLGDIDLVGTDDGLVGIDVVDGQFRVGAVTVDGDRVNADVVMNVFRSGASGQPTLLQADSIDFSGLDKNHTASINVANATLSVLDGIDLNGNAESGLWLDNNASVSANSISGASIISVENGSILSVKDDIVLSGGADSLVSIAGGTLTAGRLDLGNDGEGGLVLVGDQNRKGTLIVGEAALRGGTLFADPTWVDGASSGSQQPVRGASSILIEKFNLDTTDGDIIIGQNSHFTYGSLDTDWLPARINSAGIWGQTGNYNVAATLGLYKPLILGEGYSISVNGGITASEITQSDGSTIIKPSLDGEVFTPGADTAHFGSDSLLVVNAGALNKDTAALTAASGQGKLDVEDGAKLYIYNAKSGEEVKVVDGFDSISNTVGNTAWISSNNLNDSEMTRVVIRPNGSAVVASVTARDAKTVYQNASEGVTNTLNTVYGFNSGMSALNDVDSDNAGVSYVSKATSKMYNGYDLNHHVATIESAAQMAAVGGAPMHAFNIMRLTSDTIRKRFSFSAGHVPHPYGHDSDTMGNAMDPIESDSAFGSIACRTDAPKKSLLSVWAAPLFQRNTVSDMDIGGFDNEFSTNMYGANLGFDFNLRDNISFGILGSLGSGKSKTKDNALAYTENSIDFAGVSGYAGWSTCNLSILADGGFQRLKNDITQDNWVESGRNTTDPKVHGWNFGVTAEFLAVTPFADIVPHVAVRYEGVETGDHSIQSSRGVLFEVDSDTQHVVTVPVGVSVSKDFTSSSGGRLTPYADVGALFAMGQKEYNPMVNIPTLRGEKFTARVLDSTSFTGSVGLNGQKGKVFGSVNYNVLASSKQTSHGFWANLGLNF